MMQSTYLFELGRQPDLSIAEVLSYARIQHNPLSIKKQAGGYLIVHAESPFDPKTWMKRLGGTIKIGVSLTQKTNIQETILAHLETAQPDGKITFSLSGPNAKRTALNAKKELKGRGRSVRYVEAKNTATILHNNLVEKQGDLTVVEGDVFVTKAIQDIEAFGERDFGRPGRAARRGMLPPKLARIMINVAEADASSALLDPFCGSGTVLMEAGLMGYTNLLGSDASPDAVTDTKKSLDWLKKTYALNAIDPAVYLSDAQHIDSVLDKGSIDCIVSEPYLGKPLAGNESKDMLKKQTKELQTLYMNAFRTFHQVLKPGGTVVFVIPTFRYEHDWIRIDIAKDIQNLGFTEEPLHEKQPYLLYARNNQRVGREIWRWKKR